MLVAQSFPTLCNSMNRNPPFSFDHGDSSGKNTGVGCHALFQGIFPTRDWNQVSCIAGGFFRRRQWHPTPVLLPGKSHGRRSLVGCSPWGSEESDMTEWLHFHFSLLCIGERNGNPLQCSCLENPRDRVAQSRTQMKWLSSSSSRWILYCLSHGKPKNTGADSLSLLQGIFLTQESNQGVLHCRQIIYQLSY